MKKLLVGIVAFSVTLVVLPLVAAFEAHVINVTASIDNALSVPIESIDFGTVFPQEDLAKEFDVSLSQTFLADGRYDGVYYFIRQKPKCARRVNASSTLPEFQQVTAGANGRFLCPDQANYRLMALLCPYLSKSETTTDGTLGENDDPALASFHGPITHLGWRENTAEQFQVRGRLRQDVGDPSDTWQIGVAVPCFGDNQCAQDWAEFVAGHNPTADPLAYIQHPDNEHLVFGCDLWLEVAGYIGGNIQI
ncbi:MAG: hypothetical protein AAB453_01185 [Patescibacteria group bacterium]